MIAATARPGRRTGTRPSSDLALQLFDGFGLRVDGRFVEVPGTVQRLLAYLCLRPGATREQVAGSLWPGSSEIRAAACLRSTLWRVNQASKPLLARGRDRLVLSDHVRIDYREWTAAASSYLDRVDAPLPEPLGDASWAGELLPAWYDDWVLAERERMRQLHLHVLDTMSVRLADEGRYATALDAALMALRLEPLRESAQRSVVRIHLAEGNVSEALRAYETYARLIHHELGVGPSALLRTLVKPYYQQMAASR
ncbi:MAG: BTAD domain-containing putative transcriptional regulator [Mycobacteriales bacterium]